MWFPVFCSCRRRDSGVLPGNLASSLKQRKLHNSYTDSSGCTDFSGSPAGTHTPPPVTYSPLHDSFTTWKWLPAGSCPMLLDAARWSRKFLRLRSCSPSSARIANFGVGATYDVSIIPTVCSTACNALNVGEAAKQRCKPCREPSRFDCWIESWITYWIGAWIKCGSACWIRHRISPWSIPSPFSPNNWLSLNIFDWIQVILNGSERSNDCEWNATEYSWIWRNLNIPESIWMNSKEIEWNWWILNEFDWIRMNFNKSEWNGSHWNNVDWFWMNLDKCEHWYRLSS